MLFLYVIFTSSHTEETIMAEGGSRDSLNYILECPICNEDFTLEDGDNVPRMLPCNHSLCEKCMEGILRQNPEGCNLLQCPECMKKHPAPSRAVSFPQNKFLLPLVRRKQKAGFCQEHNREMTLFCKDPDCEKSICTIFMLKEHKSHELADLQDYQEEQQKILAVKADERQRISQAKVGALEENKRLIKRDLQRNKERLLELSESFAACENQIEHEKEAKIKEITDHISRVYNQMLQSVRDRKQKESEIIHAEVQKIDAFVEELNSIEQEMNITLKTEHLTNIIGRLKQQRELKHYKTVQLIAPLVQELDRLCHVILENDTKVGIFGLCDQHETASIFHLNSKGNHFI